MNKLLVLNEELVQRASQLTVKPSAPIKPEKRNKLPISPTLAWSKSELMMKKVYVFEDISSRNIFLFQLLGLEEDKGHHASIKIEEKEVTVVLTTKILNRVTELDQEYAHMIDLIEKEVKEVDFK